MTLPADSRSCDGPALEAERLAELASYDILDTPPEEDFDRFARLTAQAVGADMAMLSFVDDKRHWVKAATGWGTAEIPSSIAFGDHVLRQAEPLVVSDAAVDSRFADHPTVAGGLRLRFCAGIALRTPSGHVIGTLCAMDTQPRRIMPAQIAQLRDLAGAVMTTLELRRARLWQRQATKRDTLTGLPNRERLMEHLRALWTRRAEEEAPFCLLHMGCNGLQAVNDTLGYAAGDRLLGELARALPGWLRTGDLVARYVADEFVAVLGRCDEQAACRIGERLAGNVRALMSRNAWTVTLAIGMAVFRADMPEPEPAVALARRAMLQAKRQRREQILVAASAPLAEDPELLPETTLQQHLLEGLSRQEFFLNYQPIVPLGAAGRPYMEALARWRSPAWGVLDPSLFMPACERSGLILPLGQHVLRLAARQMRSWMARGEAPERVAVNVSGVQVADPDFADSVLDILRAADVPAERLEIELTESLLIDETPAVLEALNRLAGAGVALAIDDFGTGFSSLRRLRNLPVHRVKIDREFVRNIVDSPRDASIVTAIVGMARALGLGTVGEGVETQAQRDRLRELGCDFGQGWLFGRPAGDIPPGPGTQLSGN